MPSPIIQLQIVDQSNGLKSIYFDTGLGSHIGEERLASNIMKIQAEEIAHACNSHYELVEALKHFVSAADEAEKMLVARTHENASEWFSAVLKLMFYRLSYGKIQDARALLAKVSP